MVVTKCICTLHSCYCTLCVTLSVSLAFSSVGCGGMIIRSFICNNCFTYVLCPVIWDVTKRCVWERERKQEATTTASHKYQQKRRIKTGISGCDLFDLIADCLYSAILRSQADSLCSHVILHEWLAFYSEFWNIHRSGVLTALAWLVPHETVAISAQVLCTPYYHAQCHFMQSHIGRVHACLIATCHLHFWQNDWDLLRATAVTWGWNGYRNKSQHRKLSLEKKILPPLLQGFEPATFHSRFWRSNHWAIPAPVCCCLLPTCYFHQPFTWLYGGQGGRKGGGGWPMVHGIQLQTNNPLFNSMHNPFNCLQHRTSNEQSVV